MEFKRLDIPDVILIKPNLFPDSRGFLAETFKESEFSAFGISERFVQENHSKSCAGVLRGLHFQKEPHSQSKIIRVVSGSILDVAVDIRKDAPTFGKYVSCKLSAENRLMLYIPIGFAHGFLALEDDTEIVYIMSKEYHKESESGIIWDDKDIAIKWGIVDPIVSKKDSSWPTFKEVVR